MKLIACFVAGTVDAAVSAVNQLKTVYECSGIVPGIQQTPFISDPDTPFAKTGHTDEPGHYVLFKATDSRAKHIEAEWKRLFE